MRAAVAVAAAALAALLPGAAVGGAPATEVGVADAMDKLRPGDPIPAGRALDLDAPGNGCAAGQIAVRAEAGLAALTARAEPLRGPRPLPVALYRVATLTLDRPSGPDGAPGEWPDPLVPARDAFFGEERRAFPVAVGRGRLQAIWVEVCVPGGTPAGTYAGAVELADGARPIAAVPLALRVYPFDLPRSPTFAAAFGLSTRIGTRALGAPDDPTVARSLAAAALRHRVTPFVLSADPPGGTCTAAACGLDWRAYDAEVAPILDGTLVPGVKGAFAEVRVPGRVWSGPERDALATLRAWRAHFEARGWSDRLWLYTLDEPRPDQLAELARRAGIARSAGVRVIATTVPAAPLAGLVDAFAPNVTLLPEAPDGARAGRVGFFYASCLSHGCGELPARGARRTEMVRAFSGWPGYEIDRPGAAARAMGWLAFRRGLDGEIYYDMLQTWPGDPWRDVRAFAGNGDGTLLYPGRPAELGGRSPFPVESIRLKLVRAGLEDLELLRLASARGEGALAARLVARLAPSPRAFERRAAPWRDARRSLCEALSAPRR